MAEAADSTPTSGGQFTLTLADLNTTVNHEPRVSHLRLAAALGYEQPHKLAHLIERHMGALERFGSIPSTVDVNRKGAGRRGKMLWLNKRQALYLCTKSETPRATEVTIQMVEVFDAYLETTVRVKAHRRKLPGQEAASVPELRDGQAVVRIFGRTVLIDMVRFDPTNGERALLFTLDGGMRLDRVVRAQPHTIRGERVGHVLTPLPNRGAHRIYEAGWIIGTVVEPKMTASPDQASPKLARRPKAGRRRGASSYVAPIIDLAASIPLGAA